MQSFPEIREKGFVFVDKSQFIEKLHALGKYFFLSRPRRFGKSLFLSMLKAYYEGKKELFVGLAADSGNHDWQSFPVLHLDFTGRDYTDPDSLNSRLRTIFRRGFLLQLMGVYTHTSADKSWTDIVDFYEDISEGRVEEM